MLLERNAPCPCGSRKKYKKCCLDLGQKILERKSEELEGQVIFPLTSKEIPLALLVALIENGQIQDEIPFDLIAEEYPDLLNDWYPGYPGFPREMMEGDPVYAEGRVEGEFLILYDISGIDKMPISPLVKEEFGIGECKVWLKKDGDSWMATLQRHNNSSCKSQELTDGRN